MFMSEGVTKTAHHKREKLLQLLQQASEQGKWPIITENASCALELKSEQFSLVVQDAIHFIAQALAEYPLKQKDRAVMLHVNCSISRLHEKEDIIALAKRCAKEVIVPPDIYCCGYAGSKGITTPELNANALKTLKAQIPHDCQQGYTCLQTCEIGLTKHSGIPYHSILNLVADSMN
jgi:D-lactate dehydrogenase